MSSKKIIIVAPHFPPSNLAAVHRTRLFAQHLPSFGWEPIVVTVHEKYYEEELDYNLEKLLPQDLRIVKTKAISTKPIRLVGDIGIRGFYRMYKAILHLIQTEKIAFLYIPIPSHFAALLGRLIHQKTGVRYGIDYIDPWVHQWPGTEKKFSKHWWSMKLGKWLEPIAVKKASLITGVSPGYYEAVLKRNPHLQQEAIVEAMPYGGEEMDHEIVTQLELKPYLFDKTNGIIDMVYAGAMLPKAFGPLEKVLQSIVNDIEQFKKVRFHFIGTGTSPNNPVGFSIKHLALKYGLWETIIFEYPKRIPYMDVLTHLNAANGIFILGSTEAHYSPSKVFQSIFSKKPIFAILHSESSASPIIEKSRAGIIINFNGENDTLKIQKEFKNSWCRFLEYCVNHSSEKMDASFFNNYSARHITHLLANALEKVNPSNNEKN